MKRLVPLLAFVAMAATASDTRPVLISGEVEALDSQTIFVPPSNTSPIVIRNFLPEGAPVRKGDVVLRIDSASTTNIDQLRMDRERARAKTDSETATLEVAAIEAEKALVNAQAALDKAKVDAALPKQQITALDYDRYQAELGRATRDLAIKQDSLKNARAAVARRKEDGALEVKKLQINEAFQLAQLAQSEVRATRDGIVVHGYSPFNGERMDEGSTAWPGNAAGTVLGDGRMVVTAWVLEADRPYLRDGQAVNVRFDALPGVVVTGKLAGITSAPEARPRWGLGRYFRARIALPDDHGLPLVAGMSVLVEPLAPGAAAAGVRQAKAAAPAALAIEGEIASRRTMPVSPPTISYVWNYKLAFLAPEGTMVQAGQPIAVFESTEVMNQLISLQGTLKERERALDKLQLDQAEADRAGVLAQAEAQSNADKAARKATMPKELIRRVDYDKLVIDRVEKAQLAKLMQAQYEAQRRARQAERAGLQSDVAQLRAKIAALVKGQAALTVVAPRRGLVLHRIGFNGEKFAIGSQVFVGLSVATLADPDQLGVNARVPEAQAAGVQVGQAARVVVAGTRQTLAAHVTGLGRAFHGKSAAQAAVVRDVQLEFDTPAKDLKPGAAVQVDLLPGAPRRIAGLRP
ncbi:HlyD family efflux transporter periplasmic adaptor subunit [Telluria mixta]|uniref:HlyD family efflux transporter periplasmic adaptor subunit n=1 Tax=Telluria mixta TaxID=34071 RepID=A0ABT2C147_9BURK|nr:HlyD family efflux transporter periplasmic adaptor subunit [Telluria mixta]MCS0631089.1 HlyD family efflux transporter periplasmic adaptor subunit [Telluria mixta]WEM95632.1 HlyD family efflux transporter periplasmic adaptor subunit [Telluria mixta]